MYNGIFFETLGFLKKLLQKFTLIPQLVYCAVKLTLRFVTKFLNNEIKEKEYTLYIRKTKMDKS